MRRAVGALRFVGADEVGGSRSSEAAGDVPRELLAMGWAMHS